MLASSYHVSVVLSKYVQTSKIKKIVKAETGFYLFDNQYSIDYQPSSHPKALAPSTAAFMLIRPEIMNLALPLNTFSTCSL